MTNATLQSASCTWYGLVISDRPIASISEPLRGGSPTALDQVQMVQVQEQMQQGLSASPCRLSHRSSRLEPLFRQPGWMDAH